MNKPQSDEPAKYPDETTADPKQLPSARKAVVPARRKILPAGVVLPGFASLSFNAEKVNVTFECQFLDKDSFKPRPLILQTTSIWNPTLQPVEVVFYLNPWPTPTYITISSALVDAVFSIGFYVYVQGLQKGDLFQVKTDGGILQDIDLTWVDQNNTLVVSGAQANDTWTTFPLLYTR
jgi:hypothetical protein